MEILKSEIFSFFKITSVSSSLLIQSFNNFHFDMLCLTSARFLDLIVNLGVSAATGFGKGFV